MLVTVPNVSHTPHLCGTGTRTRGAERPEVLVIANSIKCLKQSLFTTNWTPRYPWAHCHCHCLHYCYCHHYHCGLADIHHEEVGVPHFHPFPDHSLDPLHCLEKAYHYY